MKKSYPLLVLLSLGCITACHKEEKEETETGKYIVTQPLVADTSVIREYVSQIQSLQNIEIHAMVKGYLESINVDEGQFVKTGQILFRIMPKEYEAEFQKAKAEQDKADIEWQNAKRLADKNIISDTELALAKANLDAAKAERARAELMLSFTEIKAPFDGVIDRIPFKPGSAIDEGTLLTTLSNNKDVYAYFNVSESEYLDFKANKKNEKDTLSLILANNKMHPYRGYIQNIEGEFNNETGNIAFRAKFPNPDFILKHGETGKVQLKSDIKNAIIIPQKATYEIQDKTYVYLITKDNEVKSQCIHIRQRLPNVYIIDSGINQNDKILLEGVQNVKEDERITYAYVAPRTVVDSLQLIR